MALAKSSVPRQARIHSEAVSTVIPPGPKDQLQLSSTAEQPRLFLLRLPRRRTRGLLHYSLTSSVLRRYSPSLASAKDSRLSPAFTSPRIRSLSHQQSLQKCTLNEDIIITHPWNIDTPVVVEISVRQCLIFRTYSRSAANRSITSSVGLYAYRPFDIKQHIRLSSKLRKHIIS